MTRLAGAGHPVYVRNITQIPGKAPEQAGDRTRKKTEDQLVEELTALRQQIVRLESSEIRAREDEAEAARYCEYLEKLLKVRTAELRESTQQLGTEIGKRMRIEAALKKKEDRPRSYMENTGELIDVSTTLIS